VSVLLFPDCLVAVNSLTARTSVTMTKILDENTSKSAMILNALTTLSPMKRSAITKLNGYDQTSFESTDSHEAKPLQSFREKIGVTWVCVNERIVIRTMASTDDRDLQARRKREVNLARETIRPK
jgi:hypothetical protein